MLLLPSLSLCLCRIELGKAHLQDQESALRTRPGILKNETLTVSLSWKFCVLANCRLQPCESPGTKLKIHLVTLFVVTRKDFPNSQTPPEMANAAATIQEIMRKRRFLESWIMDSSSSNVHAWRHSWNSWTQRNMLEQIMPTHHTHT